MNSIKKLNFALIICTFRYIYQYNYIFYFYIYIDFLSQLIFIAIRALLFINNSLKISLINNFPQYLKWN